MHFQKIVLFINLCIYPYKIKLIIKLKHLFLLTSLKPNKIKHNETGAGEMTQWLTVLTALVEDLSFDPSTHKALNNCCNYSCKVLYSLLLFLGF